MKRGALASCALALLLVSSTARAQDRPPVYVELSEAGDTAAPIAEAVAHVLVSAGLPVTLGRARRDCGTHCVHVRLRREATGFVIDALYLGQASHARVQLPADTSALDQTHALAIEVELLVDDALAATPRVAERPAPAPIALPPEEATLAPPQVSAPDPGRDARLASATLDTPAPRAPMPVSVGVNAPDQPTPPRPERLAFQADAITLGTATGDLITFGVGLALRVPLGERYDVRLGAAILDADREAEGEHRIWRKLDPFTLHATMALPDLPDLRVGAGVETVVMLGDDLSPAHEPAVGWSWGAVGRVEWRHPMHSFVARVALAAAVHPFHDRLLTSQSLLLLEYPAVTLGASLGLEFRLW